MTGLPPRLRRGVDTKIIGAITVVVVKAPAAIGDFLRTV
jgi:hypothetical protein